MSADQSALDSPALHRGDRREAARAARDLYHSLRNDMDLQSRWAALAAWLEASGGQVPSELLDRELSMESDDPVAQQERLRAHAFWQLGQGRPGDAAALLEQAWHVADRRPISLHAALLPAWIATALRLEAESLPLAAEPRRRRLLAQALRWAHTGREARRRFPDAAPHALREEAILEGAASDPRKAGAGLERAAAVSRQQGADYELALTTWEQARLGEALGWSSASRQREEARAMFEALGVDASPLAHGRLPVLTAAEPAPPAFALADRFTTLLEAGRRISTRLDVESVRREVAEAGNSLLRAEICHLLLPGEGEGDRLLEACLASGQIEEVGDDGASLTEGGALCAPVRVGAETDSFLHATWSAIVPLTDEDRMVAQFLVSVAGTALENAHRFSEISELSASLSRSNKGKDLALQEKEVLLREVHHRVKNNLQLIASLLRLKGAGQAEGPIKDLQDRVVSMALIHEAVYATNDLAQVPMEVYLPALARHLLASRGASAAAFRTDLRVEPVRLPVDVAVPCGLVAHELISNALEHAFPNRRGSVSMSLREEPGGVVLEIIDDGVGLQPGSEGLELRLVRELGDQMKASATCTVGEGTRWTVRIPVPSRSIE